MAVERCTVRIRDARGRVWGAGFLVGEMWLLTCAHVLNKAMGRDPYATERPDVSFELDFPNLGAAKVKARVCCWKPRALEGQVTPKDGEDIAVLEITEGAPPPGAAPARLAREDRLWGHRFVAFGFPAAYDDGVWTDGRFLGPQARGYIQLNTETTAHRIQQGFSGSPVWDSDIEAVVGMVVTEHKPPAGAAGGMIPCALLLRAWPELARFCTPARPQGALLSPPVDLTEVPNDHGELHGREDELEALDEAWRDPSTHIFVLAGWGGVGKSAIVRAWLNRLARDGYRGADRVLGWSFQAQGVEQARAATSDDFFARALRFFDCSDQPGSNRIDAGVGALLDKIRSQRALLVLDGIDALQDNSGPGEGQLRDPALQRLLRGLADSNPGLCIVTTRPPFRDVAGSIGKTVIHRDLPGLDELRGVWFLRSSGVVGPHEELASWVRRLDGHPLSLRLLGGFAREVHQGRVVQVELQEVFDVPMEEHHAQHARTICRGLDRSYGRSLERFLLRAQGLFDRPIDRLSLDALLALPAIDGLTDGIDPAERRTPALARAVGRLKRAGILYGDIQSRIEAHPLVRHEFARLLAEQEDRSLMEGHHRLFRSLAGRAAHLPETIEDMATLYDAVRHGCLSGLHVEAYREVFWPRIHRGMDHYSTSRLGLFGRELATLQLFYAAPWERLKDGFTEREQIELLKTTAYTLRAAGRNAEATGPLRAAQRICVAQEAWRDAAVIMGILSTVYGETGPLAQAVAAAEEAIQHADRSGDVFQRREKRAFCARAHDLLGNTAAAARLFAEAYEILPSATPPRGGARSVSEHGYREYLMNAGRSAEALARVLASRTDALRASDPFAFALDTLALGRLRAASDPREAGGLFALAIEELRRAGHVAFLPGALLSAAEHQLASGDRTGGEVSLRRVLALTRDFGLMVAEVDVCTSMLQHGIADGDPAAQERRLEDLQQRTGYHRARMNRQGQQAPPVEQGDAQ